jgi:23S rRNA pseudouridine1911/1915/1917 synthase
MLFTVSEDASGARIDVELTRRTGFSRSHVAAAIRAGNAAVNGEPAKPSRILEPGDSVTYTIAPPPVLEVLPQDLPLDIRFEDETLLVVNKAAGMVTHPSHGAVDNTLVNALLAHTGALPGEPVRAGLIHRLDRDTSGLLLVAKTEAALATLGRAMQKRYIAREYRGIVAGVPRELDGVIRGPIGRDPHNRLKYAIRADGKPAVTHYALRQRFKDATELTLTLETGRTHQIRVHMSESGHPIVGERVYIRGFAGEPIPAPRLMLHAAELGFVHPATNAEMRFDRPPPADFAETLARLRR